jgi:hypothetical protein
MIRSSWFRNLAVGSALVATILAANTAESEWKPKDRYFPEEEEVCEPKREERDKEKEESRLPEPPKPKPYRGYNSSSRQRGGEPKQDGSYMRNEPKEGGRKEIGFYVSPKIGGFIPREIFDDQYGGMLDWGVDIGVKVPLVDIGIDFNHAGASGDVFEQKLERFAFGESRADSTSLSMDSIGIEAKLKPPYLRIGGGYAAKFVRESFFSSGSSRDWGKSESFREISSDNATVFGPYLFFEFEVPRDPIKFRDERRRVYEVPLFFYIKGRYDFDAETELNGGPINVGGVSGFAGLRLRLRL